MNVNREFEGGGGFVVRNMCGFIEGEESWRNSTAKEIRSRHCRIY
jgi:hypothetical protein